MFERFADDARAAVVAAQEQARELRHGWIGTEHILLGVLAGQGGGARLLGGFGVRAEDVRADVERIIGTGEEDIDAALLATMGIDLDAVRDRVERAFGPGALGSTGPRCGGQIPFTKRSKKAIELALREGIALGAGEIRSEHLVLGLLREGDGIASRVLSERGMTHEAARARVAGRDAA
jgi:ATP-dependent Clp protease ATP-binding subunit ClpA